MKQIHTTTCRVCTEQHLTAEYQSCHCSSVAHWLLHLFDLRWYRNFAFFDRKSSCWQSAHTTAMWDSWDPTSTSSLITLCLLTAINSSHSAYRRQIFHTLRYMRTNDEKQTNKTMKINDVKTIKLCIETFLSLWGLNPIKLANTSQIGWMAGSVNSWRL